MTKLDSSKRIEGKMLTDMDKNNSNEDNSNMDIDMENEKESMSNYTEDWLGQKEPSLRAWKRIFRSSNFQTPVENLPKLQHADKRPSPASSSLNSSIHKKQAICSDSLNVSQT